MINLQNKKVIIIGAGIAGLSAGCYLQMNGYQTEIFELHNLPGGLCTSWKRNGYTIDGCIHGLVGSSPTHPFYHLWNEIINMDDLKFHNFDIKSALIFGKNEKFYEYSDLDSLQGYMISLGPEDEKVIRKFTKAVRKFQKSKGYAMMLKKPREFYNIFDFLKMLRLLPELISMKKWNISAEEFSERFSNPLLKKAVKHFLSPILFEILVLSTVDLKQSGYPLGGSLHFSKLFEKRYLELGGEIHYRSKVKKINTTSNGDPDQYKAVGITLENGEVHEADIVISAADGRATIFEMLGGVHVNDKILDLYENMKTLELNTSRILVNLGVNNPFTDQPRHTNLILDEPIRLPDGDEYNSLEMRLFNFDPAQVPAGKTLVEVSFSTKNYEFWIDLRKNDPTRYKELKQKMAQDIINVLEDHFGEVKDNIEMIDVATPATFNRYTNNWKGSIQGWANENIFAMIHIKKELPNLDHFYMIGQWVQPGGGVPTAFTSGRDLAKIICKKEKKKFTTQKKA